MENFQKRVQHEITKELKDDEIRDKTVKEGVEVDISPNKDGKITKTVTTRGLGK